MKAKKAFLAGFMVVALQSTLFTSAFAGAPVFDDPKVEVLFNGSKVESTKSAGIVNQRTLVPLDYITNGLDAKATYDAKTKTITIVKDNTTIKLVVDSNEAIVSVKLDSKAQVRGDEAYVPLRFFSELLGAKVVWNAEEEKAYVETAAGSTAAKEYSNTQNSAQEETPETPVPPTQEVVTQEPVTDPEPAAETPAASTLEPPAQATETPVPPTPPVQQEATPPSQPGSTGITKEILNGEWAYISDGTKQIHNFHDGDQILTTFGTGNDTKSRAGTFSVNGNKLTLDYKYLIDSNDNFVEQAGSITFIAKLSDDGKTLHMGVDENSLLPFSKQ